MILKLSFSLLDVATLLTRMKWLRLRNHVDTALQKEKGTTYFLVAYTQHGIKWVNADKTEGTNDL